MSNSSIGWEAGVKMKHSHFKCGYSSWFVGFFQKILFRFKNRYEIKFVRDSLS